MIKTPDSLAMNATAGVAPAVGSDLALRLEHLTQGLDKLHLKLTGESTSLIAAGLIATGFIATGDSTSEQAEICSKLLGEISVNADQLRQRLAQADSTNHELRLQLQARSSESQTDALTGLANRRSFDHEFGERCLAAQQSRCPVIMVLFDIDHFKTVNDTRGHHVGDAVLRGLAEVLRDNRPPGALMARYGGEEFAMVLSGVYLDNAIELVEQLRAQVAHTQFIHEGQKIAVTISCGIAQLCSDDHREELIQRADTALYASKQAGRNRTSWHDGSDLHLAAFEDRFARKNAEVEGPELNCPVIDLSAKNDRAASVQSDMSAASASVLTPRSTRANWCDGAMLFWSIRQRLAEWKRGGEPFCVLAIDVDGSSQMAQSYGIVALHFMMRAQMLHLDAALRDMDIVARVCQSRIVVVLPRTTFASLPPILQRLRATMDRLAYPTASELLEYSISIGITEATKQDDAQHLVRRVEETLSFAQKQGKGQFFAQDLERTWAIEEPLLG